MTGPLWTQVLIACGTRANGIGRTKVTDGGKEP